jgi:TonB family protein
LRLSALVRAASVEPRWQGAAGSLALHLLLAAAVIWPLARQVEQAPRLPPPEVLMLDLVRAPARPVEKAAPAQRGDRAQAVRPGRKLAASAARSLREETVSLENGGRYRCYLREIKRRIEQGWQLAASTHEGRLTLIFSVERSGHLSAVRLLNSSGDERLDGSALWAVRQAGPFAPLPSTLDAARLHVKASFCYQLASR